MDSRTRTSRRRRLVTAGLAVALCWGTSAGLVLADDEPVAEPPVGTSPPIATGVVGDATVAVAAPPVPPTTVVVAVGLPPVPPTTEVVAVGLPPIPPGPPSEPTSTDSGSEAVEPQALASRRPTADQLERLVDVLAPVVATVEAALDLLDASV